MTILVDMDEHFNSKEQLSKVARTKFEALIIRTSRHMSWHYFPFLKRLISIKFD